MLAIGSRYAGGGRGGWNPFRRLVSRAAIWIARPVQSMGLRVRDPLSGFFLVRRRCVENVMFQTSGFKLFLEILVRGRIDSIEEIPFAWVAGAGGRSKVEREGGLALSHASGPAVPGAFAMAHVSFGRLKSWQQHAQQQKAQHAQEEHQRHPDAGLAIDFRNEVAGPDIEGHPRRERQPVCQPSRARAG